MAEIVLTEEQPPFWRTNAKRKHRKKRRQGTWSQLLDGSRAVPGPDPPSG